MDVFSTYYGVFVDQCVKLLLRTFEFGVFLFDCFVYCQNVTCPKHLSGMGITQEMEDIIIRSCVLNLCAKNRAFSCGLMTLMLKVVGFIFCGYTIRTGHISLVPAPLNIHVICCYYLPGDTGQVF